jgi:hypothetical protein
VKIQTNNGLPFYYFIGRPNKLWPANCVFSLAIPEIWRAFLPLAARVLFVS